MAAKFTNDQWEDYDDWMAQQAEMAKAKAADSDELKNAEGSAEANPNVADQSALAREAQALREGWWG